MREALEKTPAAIIYLCNLVTNTGQTDDYKVHDFVHEIERYLGPIVDFVLYNNAKPDQALLDKYAHKGELSVEVDEAALQAASYRAIGDNFVAPVPDGDNIEHRYIRHDSGRVAGWVSKIINNDL